MKSRDFHELRRLLLIAARANARRAAQCQGKQGFDNRVTAALAMRTFKRTAKAYRCQHCNLWHVGNNSAEHQDKRERRRMKAESGSRKR